MESATRSLFSIMLSTCKEQSGFGASFSTDVIFGFFLSQLSAVPKTATSLQIEMDKATNSIYARDMAQASSRQPPALGFHVQASLDTLSSHTTLPTTTVSFQVTNHSISNQNSYANIAIR